jgi:hypothetical protein
MSSDPGRPQRHSLGVDFGTSNTVAVARWPDGRARPILIDGSPLLPSAVYAEPAGQLIVGRDAVHSARLDPARFEPNPKRRIDDGTVLLGDREVPVVDLFSAVLARVAEEWHRAVGPVRPAVTLTCPATWGSTRRTMLADAAAMAGLDGARLVAEPVAAATYFAQVLGREVPIGSVVVVHDFGAGTFDVSVVARTAEGFEVLAVDGRDDIGGLDVDAAIVEHLGVRCAELNPVAWRRLTFPGTVEERRAQRQLWDDVRVAKERLSRTQSADLVIPLLDLEVHLTRDELETLAGPVLSQTVDVTQALIRGEKLAEGRLAGVFLVGGASRIPLVATLLHRALGEAPVVIEQPELVVAEGSLLADAALLATGPAAPGPTSQLRLPHAVRNADSGSPPASASPPAPASPSASAGPDPGPDPDEDPDGPAPGDADPDPVDASAPTSPGWSGRTEQVAGAGRAIDQPWPARPWDEAAAVRLHEELWPAGTPAGDDRPDLTGPAVDPWPHAKDEPWIDDPQRTVVAHEPWGPEGNPWGAVAVGRAPAGAPAPAAARPPSAPGPPSGAGPSSGPPEQAARPGPAQPAVRVTTARGVSSARPPATAVDRRPAPARRDRPAPVPRPRRRGGLLRSLQVMISVTVLVGAPLAAAVLAYGYGNGLPLQQDAIELVKDLVRLIDQR